jgi:hypothetical protein
MEKIGPVPLRQNAAEIKFAGGLGSYRTPPAQETGRVALERHQRSVAEV